MCTLVRQTRRSAVLHKPQQLAKSLAPMTVLILLSRGELRECPVQRRKVEDRIVAKSSAPAGSLQNLTIHAIRDDRRCTSALRERNRANKIRATLLASCVAQLVQQLRHPPGARRGWPCVSRRPYSR